MTDSHKPSEQKLLGIILLARTNLNVPVRLTVYFLPAISRGLGVSLTAASLLVSLRSVAGASAPLFGLVSDRIGAHRMMTLGLSLLVTGAAVVVGLPWYATVLLGFAILGLSKSAYDPAMQAFVGHRVPYERRGRALGIAELSWSASLLLMPVSGVLIDRLGWRAPFGMVAFLGAAACWLTRRFLSPIEQATTDYRQDSATEGVGLGSLSRALMPFWQDRDTRLALTTTALLIVAQDCIMVVFGAWMEQKFGLTLAALGLVTLVIGAAELLAELGVAFFSDQWGKRRAVFVGVLGMVAGYLALPNLTEHLGYALTGTALLTLAFEFSIVGLVPIVSGLNAESRGTLMSLNVAAGSVGRMVAAPLGVTLYRTGDLMRNGIASAAICVLVLALLAVLREGQH
jgi:predicted MFS family arabinose efflux permease